MAGGGSGREDAEAAGDVGGEGEGGGDEDVVAEVDGIVVGLPEAVDAGLDTGKDYVEGVAFDEVGAEVVEDVDAPTQWKFGCGGVWLGFCGAEHGGVVAQLAVAHACEDNVAGDGVGGGGGEEDTACAQAVAAGDGGEDE